MIEERLRPVSLQQRVMEVLVPQVGGWVDAEGEGGWVTHTGP